MAPEVTVIEGRFDSVSQVGPGAVRCAWLANGAVLSGFTLRGGGTRASVSGDWYSLRSGGGVWCGFPNPLVANCIIISNAAAWLGGGAYAGTLNRCKLYGNSASNVGGGACSSTLNNCVLTGNSAFAAGGAHACTLNNSTVCGNHGGGVAWSSLRNCVVLFNTGPDHNNSSLLYSCATPLAPGAGNIAQDPQLLDDAHLATTSPCRGTGNALYAIGADIDGETWSNPPSIGCDEVMESTLVGALAVVIEAVQTNLLVNRALALSGRITGRASRLEWSFGDGPAVANVSYITSHMWTNAGEYTVTFTAFNNDNPTGVSTNLVVHVLPLKEPQLRSAAMTDNSFSFEFSGQAEANYYVETATNLNPPVTWQALQTISSTGGVVQVVDSTPTNATQFYRVRVQ